MSSEVVPTSATVGRSRKYFTSRIREVLSARSSIRPRRQKYHASLRVIRSECRRRWCQRRPPSAGAENTSRRESARSCPRVRAYGPGGRSTTPRCASSDLNVVGGGANVGHRRQEQKILHVENPRGLVRAFEHTAQAAEVPRLVARHQI